MAIQSNINDLSWIASGRAALAVAMTRFYLNAIRFSGNSAS